MAIEHGNDVTSFVGQLHRLQDMLAGAKRTISGFLGGDSVKLSRTELDDLSSSLAASVPDVVTWAQEIVSKAEALENEAKQKAESIVQAAKDDAAQIASQSKAEFEQMQAKIQDASAQARRIQEESEAHRVEMVNQAQAQAASIVEDGKRQAQQIVAEGQAQADQLVQQENVLRRAQMAAQELTEATQTEMAQLRHNTFNLLDSMLGKGESYITSLVQELHQERENLNSNR